MTLDELHNDLVYFQLRCDAARVVGGIHHTAVMDQIVKVPPGWWFDAETSYHLPPNFHFHLETIQ